MRILIVDDHKELRTSLNTALKGSLFAVDTAEDGQEGLKLAMLHNYDLIILDNLMPKKSGLEVCQAIRAAGKTVPILILSVRSDTTTKVDLLNAGADDYLIKPFSYTELLARVKALLRRQPRIEGQILTVGDLVMDSRKQTVVRNGHMIDLRRKEFMLLEYLMKNVGSVVTREMMVQHVWDSNADLFSNSIETHILHLRTKLGKPPLIQTVRGSGYKMIAPKETPVSTNA